MGNIADWPATLSPTVTSRHCVGVKYSIHLCMDRHPGAASDDRQYKKNMHGIIQWLCHRPEGIHRSADVRGKQTEAIQWSCSMSIENISDDSGWSSKKGEKKDCHSSNSLLPQTSKIQLLYIQGCQTCLRQWSHTHYQPHNPLMPSHMHPQ